MKNYGLTMLSLALIGMLGIAGATYAFQGHDDHAGEGHKAEGAPAAKNSEDKHGHEEERSEQEIGRAHV